MPYIITVNQPGFLPEQDPYAVATIEEARDAAWEEVTDRGASVPDDPQWHNATTRLPEHGGTVGPLPDGYVIDVRKVDWMELASLAGMTTFPRTDPDHIIDAYNG